MYPESFCIGNFPINTYEVLLAVAILLKWFVASRLGGARRTFPRADLGLGLWTIVGGLVGQKILMLLTAAKT